MDLSLLHFNEPDLSGMWKNWFNNYHHTIIYVYLGHYHGPDSEEYYNRVLFLTYIVYKLILIYFYYLNLN